MSLDGLPSAHLRVLLDGLSVFERYGLLLAGGYAFRAHEILHRPSQDLDFATRNDTPLPEIAKQVQLAFQRAGYSVRLVEATSLRYARLVLRLPGSGDELEMDLLKEALEPRWVTVQITATVSVRAVSLEDTIGLKARAWHDRFVIRDIIDLHAVAGTFSYADLENLARRHDLLGYSPLSLRTAKEVLDRGVDGPLYTGIELERKAYATLRSSADFAEGVAAFIDKAQARLPGPVTVMPRSRPGRRR